MASPRQARAWTGTGIGKSALLVLAILAPVYLTLMFVSDAWNVDFRLWLVTFLPLTPGRLAAFLGYVVPFAFFFIAQGITLAGLARWKGGKAPLWQEMLVNSVVLTLGAVVWLALTYIPLINGGTVPWGSDPNTVTSAGMGGINYTALLVLWPLSACIYTYFYRKTGRIYVGSLLVTAIVVWSLTSSNSFAVLPLFG